ncbi:MAG: helix-turn-helix transcriptional regulator [Proteobacteria bacterium]|nr:helix-turn-helix transcriptional regulator [Pseudomonadota bacterium]
MAASAPKTMDFRKKGRKRRPQSGGSELGDILKTLRTEQGWTLLDASQESAISHRIIAKLENGQIDTSIANLEKYLKLFGLTITVKRIDASQKEEVQNKIELDKKGLPKW